MGKESLIFISHSNPDDNYFASWLAAKLRKAGYEVWVDVDDLKGGESFWPEIESKIRHCSIKFLACVTESYINKASTPKTGVRKEIVCAQTVEVENFIIPLRVDGSSWSKLPIDILELNGIDFFNNWASGLKELLDLLNEEDIPKQNTDQDLIQFWYDSLNISTSTQQKQESYFTNWFKIEPPEKVFIHKVEKKGVNKLSQFPFSYYQDKDLLISFFDKKVIQNELNVRQTYEYLFQDFINQDVINLTKYTELYNPRWKIISLLNKLFPEYLKGKNLFPYEFSNKTGFFFKKGMGSTSLKHLDKTRKSLVGKKDKYSWHYGVSVYAALHPFPHYKISHHVVFKNGDGKLVNKNLQHSLRRSACSTWFNRDWLELLLAWFTEVAQGEKHIKVYVDLDKVLQIHSTPHLLISDIGYDEPVTS